MCEFVCEQVLSGFAVRFIFAAAKDNIAPEGISLGAYCFSRFSCRATRVYADGAKIGAQPRFKEIADCSIQRIPAGAYRALDMLRTVRSQSALASR